MATDSSVLVRLRLLGAQAFAAQAKTASGSLSTVGPAGGKAAAGLRATGVAGGAAAAGLAGVAGVLKTMALPLAAVGVVSGKLAMDFEDSMSKIVGLVGIAKPEVDAMGEGVLSLAKALPQSPKELADALFFVTSAGLRGETAMEALKASAEAAAGGLGETKSVADAVTSAMNAYGPEVLKAKQATDILTAAVREGKMEAAELSPVIGSVLPMAQAAGVGFEEVAGGLALMSKSGTNAARGATQMTAILGTFAKPTKQMTDALDTMGMSLGGVRKGLRTDMVDTLEKLRSKASEAGVDLSQVFGNKRAITGVLQLTRNLKETRGVMEGVAGSSGATDKAFQEAAKTTKFQLASAMSTLQVVGVRIGRAILPVLVPLFSKAANAAATFFEALGGEGKIGNAARSIKGALAPVFAWIGANLPKLGRILVGAGKSLLDAFKPAMPFFQNVLLPLLGGIAAGVIGGVVVAFKVAVPIIKVLASAFGFVGRALAPLKGVFGAVGAVIGFLFGGPILGAIRLGGKLGVVFKVLAAPIRFVDKAFRVVFGTLGKVFSGFAKVHLGVLRFVSTFASAPARVARAALNIVGSVIRTVGSLPGKIVGLAKRAGSGLVNGIRSSVSSGLGRLLSFMGKVGGNIVSSVVNAIKGAPGAIGAAIVDMVPGPLKGAVRKVFPGLATGGVVKQGGLAVVGERGPELMHVPTNATVFSNRVSERASAALAGGGPPIILTANLHLSGRQIHSEVFRVEQARQEVS